MSLDILRPVGKSVDLPIESCFGPLAVWLMSNRPNGLAPRFGASLRVRWSAWREFEDGYDFWIAGLVRVDWSGALESFRLVYSDLRLSAVGLLEWIAEIEGYAAL
jgi:hypothetical protein